jgi:hypothetical protein
VFQIDRLVPRQSLGTRIRLLLVFIGIQSMISAEQFLAVLEHKDLLPKDLMVNLSSFVSKSQHRISAAEVAQMLIDKGYLTPVLAERLLGSPGSQPVQTPDSSGDLVVVEDLDFAPIKDEVEPRPVIGKHRPYKPGDSGKNISSSSSSLNLPKPPNLPKAKPIEPLMEKKPPSRWASSVYDREIDTSKGIVSPRLVQLAGVEQIPDALPSRRRYRWMPILLRWGMGLGLAVIIYLIIDLIIRNVSR